MAKVVKVVKGATPRDHGYVCDVCGKPATSLARDVIRWEHVRDDYVTFETDSRTLHCGCDDHPAVSTEYLNEYPPLPERR